MVSGPPNKRKPTENNDDDDLYVTYADYMQLHNHLTKLTAVVSDIHLAIINFGGKQLADHVASAIPHIGSLPIAAPRPAPINWAAVVKGTPANSGHTPASVGQTTIDPLTVAKQAAVLMDKATRAVIERIPDKKGENSSINSDDLQMMQDLAKRHKLPIPSSSSRIDCSSLSRPVKLQFSSSSDRDAFISGFNRCKSSDLAITSIVPKPRIRR
uniref:Uncharacterized protein n=2 Tax=Caenorhabditis japonica TaxID=281687 RepID=A0A8R1DJM9_CAEJA